MGRGARGRAPCSHCLERVAGERVARGELPGARPAASTAGPRDGSALLLAEDDAKEPPLPKGLGDELMHAFGLPPSRRVGELRNALEQAVEAG